MFSEMFKFFIENELTSSKQSRFKPGDPSLNQLFDESHGVRGVFLDIQKAFDKLRHDGIIFKLTKNGI